MKKLFLICCAAVLLILSGCEFNVNFPEIPPEEEPGYGKIKYAAEFRGEWICMKNGDRWYINGNSIRVNGSVLNLDVTLVKTSENVAKATDAKNEIYYLFAARLANSSFKAQVVLLDEQTEFVNARSSQGTTGQKPPVKIINPSQPDQEITVKPDPDTGEINVTGMIPGDEVEIIPVDSEWDDITVGLTPGYGKNQNLGVIPLTQGDNIKVSIRMQDESEDITEQYADMVSRNYIVEFENIGKTNCGDIGWELSWDEDDFENLSGPKKDNFANIPPGGKKQFFLPLASRQINTDVKNREIKIALWNLDSLSKQTRKWEDTVSINYYSMRVPFSFKSEKQIQGIIKAKNGKSYYFKTTREGSAGDYTATIDVPWFEDEYTIAFLGPTIENEDATKYSFAINGEPPSDWESIDPLAFFEENKPANENESTAKKIKLKEGVSSFMGYLGGDCVDYYKIEIGALSEMRQRTITFSINGAVGGIPESITQEYGGYITLPAQDNFERSGYIFKGWNTNANGTGEFFNPNDSYRTEYNLTLYAVWIPVYMVAYDANGGKGVMQNSDFIYGEWGNLSHNEFTHPDDIKFIGWAKTPDGLADYTGGESVKDLTDIAGKTITLYAVWSYLVTLSNGNLESKLNDIQSDNRSNITYTVEVYENENINPFNLFYNSRINIIITLIGKDAVRTINLSDNGTMFTIGDGVTLILDENIILQGRNENNASLLKINSGGTLIMKKGSKITGNTFALSSFDTNVNGGGVYVDGIFIMNDGEIFDNTASAVGEINLSGSLLYTSYAFTRGGGVYVSVKGNFTMNDGRIYGNTAKSLTFAPGGSSACGGGVYSEGVFTMNGGTISGNNSSSFSDLTYSDSQDISGKGGGVYSAGTFWILGGTIYGSNDSAFSNTATNEGASFYKLNGSTAQYGKFTGIVWNGINLNTTDNKINVVDGVLN